MFRDYLEVRNWLENFIPLVYDKEELGLRRIENLLNLLGNPQKEFRSIHVAGTSGKGSTCFYLASLLSKSKVNGQWLKVGLHVSPHLVDIRERMQIFNSQKLKDKSLRQESIISMMRFIRLTSEVKKVVEKIEKEKSNLTPSYFEILVASTFKLFAEEKVDYAVIETGLGGRLDATNVLVPELSIVTNIGLDHTEILGDTLEKIAYEKAGIIKSGVPVLTAAKGEALKVIKKVASKKKSQMYTIDVQNEPKIPFVQSNSDGIFLAKKAIEILGLNIKQNDFYDVVSTSFEGRFEQIDENVILDGAHNPDKINALIDWIKSTDYRPQTKAVDSSQLAVVLVLAFKQGKDWEKIIDMLLNELSIIKVIATKYESVADTGKGSAVDPEEIEKYITTAYSLPTTVYSNSHEAVIEAMRSTDYGPQTKVLITGSLYLIGEVRAIWELPSFT